MIFAANDAHNTVTGGLSLRSNDAQTLSYEGVHEGRFTNIWTAYNADKAWFMRGFADVSKIYFVYKESKYIFAPELRLCLNLNKTVLFLKYSAG